MAQPKSQGESRKLDNIYSNYNFVAPNRRIYMHYGMGEQRNILPLTNSNIYRPWRDEHNTSTAPCYYLNLFSGYFYEDENGFFFSYKNIYDFKFSNLSIRCDGNVVTLEGKTDDAVPNEGAYSRMTRTFKVPELYDMEKLDSFISGDNYICVRVPAKDEYKRKPDLMRYKYQ